MQTFTVSLPIGAEHRQQPGTLLKEVELLEIDATCEEAFTRRKPDSPYTWMGEILTLAISKFGDAQIAAKARRRYAKGEPVDVHPLIDTIPVADVNTLLVEIHRKTWQRFISNQECLCKYCGSHFVRDIDLDKLTMSEENAEKLEDPEFNPFEITVALNQPITFDSPKVGNSDIPAFPEVDGLDITTFVFRMPTLKDARKHEKVVSNEVKFWRAIAQECLSGIKSENPDTGDSVDFPAQAVEGLRRKIFLSLSRTSNDTKKVRDALRNLPTLPFSYREECPDCFRLTPIAMEGNAFFAD